MGQACENQARPLLAVAAAAAAAADRKTSVQTVLQVEEMLVPHVRDLILLAQGNQRPQRGDLVTITAEELEYRRFPKLSSTHRSQCHHNVYIYIHTAWKAPADPVGE